MIIHSRYDLSILATALLVGKKAAFKLLIYKPIIPICAKIEKYIVYKPDHMHSAPSMSTAHLHMFSRLAIYIIFTRISSICVFRFTNGIYIPPLTYL